MPAISELGGYIQIDLGLSSLEEASIGSIASDMAELHLGDISSGYLNDPQLQAKRTAAWERVANLNPDLRAVVLNSMRGFEYARRAEENDRSFYDEEVLDKDGGSFNRFSPGSMVILRDILRSQVSPKGYREFGREEGEIYYQLGRSKYGGFFDTTPSNKWDGHGLPYDERRFPELTSLTPKEIMQAILEGELEAPRNYPIPVREEAA